MNEKVTFSIVIDGDSADELWAVGVDDIMMWLPKKLKVKMEDIKQVQFKIKYPSGETGWDSESYYRDVQ